MAKKSEKEKAGGERTEVQSAKVENIKHTLVVMSGKGGVGKSTIAANLAIALATSGARVGLMDCDMHGPTIPKLLGIEGQRPGSSKSGIEPVFVPPRLWVMSMGFLISDRDSPVIWRGPLKMTAIRQFLEDVEWGELDYLIVDLPPGTGDEPLSVVQLLPKADGALIVTTPQDVALLSVRKSINFARALKLPVLGLIENMSGFSCPHCGKPVEVFKTGGGLKACADMMVPYLGCVPLDPMIVRTGDEGKPFVLESSDSPSVKAFEEIARKVEENVNGKGKEK